MVRTLLTAPFREEHIKEFEGIPGAQVVYCADPDDAELEKAEVIIGVPKPDRLVKAVNLKLLQISNAGADQFIRNPQAFAQGAVLCNVSGAFGQSISEFTLAMALNLYKHLNLFRDNQNACLWKDEGVQYSPAGRNLLILGAGDIGTAIARIFRPFGCHITGMRRSAREVPPEFDEMITMDGLDEKLKQADIIACVLPGTAETYKLLNKDRLDLLRKDAILINCGRGNLIDCDYLAEMLNAGRIYGAALDVTDPEPLNAEHPLWKCRNCIITPHATGGSFGHLKATEQTMIDICRKNLIRYVNGEPLLNVVDFSTGYRVTDNRY